MSSPDQSQSIELKDKATPSDETLGQRVVAYAPTRRDAHLCQEVLQQNQIAVACCETIESFAVAIEDGAGVALIAQEHLDDRAINRLSQVQSNQPAWSEIPILVLLQSTDIGSQTLQKVLSLQHMTLISRPLRIAVFINTVLAKLRDRRRQFEVRDLLLETERSQRDLRREAKRLDMALQAGGMAAWEWNRDQLHWSQPLRQLYGLDEVGEFDLARMFDSIIESDRETIRKAWTHSLQSDEKFRAEFRIRHPALGERWLAAVAEPVKSKSGRTLCYAGLQWDITDRKNSELQLRQSHETFQRLINDNPQGLYVVDADMKIRYASKGAQRVFANVRPLIGCSFEEAMNTIWPKAFAEEAVARFRHTLETGTPYTAPTLVETRVDLNTIEAYDWSIEQIVLPGNRYGVVCHFYDNTQRQHSVEMLRQSERYFREIADASPAMLWVTDENHMFTFLSKSWYDTTGQSEAEGKGLGWTQATHPEDRQRAGDEFLAAANAREPFWSEYRLRLADGSYRWAVDAGRPRYDAEGRFLGYTGYVIDVNERKLFEQSLEAAKQTAENANRSRGEFLANMSHEIRTPMAAILGHADILKDHLKDPDNLQILATIRRNGNFLLNIINDILDLSKIDAGKMEIENEQVRPDGLLADVCSLMDVRASEKQLPLKVEFDGPIPEMIETDAVRLRQVLLNLVGNAIKFTEAGEVKIIVSYRSVIRQDSDVASDELQGGGSSVTSTAGDQLIFNIVDTGIGIKPEHQRTLFEPFVQADNTSTRSFGGTGLGLAICRRLAHAMGGEVSLESEYGKGSRFTLAIAVKALGPLVEPNLSLEITAEQPPETQPLSAKILVVDDRRDIRYLAQHFIERAGGTVITATNGQEAVDIVADANSSDVDLIVMDMQMPVMDGYEAAAELRRRGCKLPIVALTANAMKSDRDECLAAGCTDYTTKPLDSTKLISIIRRLTKQTLNGRHAGTRHFAHLAVTRPRRS